MRKSILRDNLRRLTEELHDYCQSQEALRQREGVAAPMTAMLARSMPLGHSCGADQFVRIAEGGAILSRPEMQRRGLIAPSGGQTERLLGTANDVFTFVGPLRYPQTSCGFMFRPQAELRPAAHSVATPFDSGGILGHVRSHDAPEEQIAFLRRHELPVPGYRDYLAGCLGVLFRSPWDYVDGTGPDATGPIAVQGGDARRWTFEVRFERQLALGASLAAVIIPVAMGARLTRQIAEWKRLGVEVRYYLVPDPADATSWRFLYDESVRYLRERLR